MKEERDKERAAAFVAPKEGLGKKKKRADEADSRDRGGGDDQVGLVSVFLSFFWSFSFCFFIFSPFCLLSCSFGKGRDVTWRSFQVDLAKLRDGFIAGGVASTKKAKQAAGGAADFVVGKKK